MTDEYNKIMFLVAESFGAELGEMTLSLWWELFAEDGISIDQIRAAAKKIIRTRKYKSMPTYADFLEHCRGSKEDHARRQADIVLDQIRRCGASGIPAFDDPVTAYLMRTVWPWRTFAGRLLEKNIPFFVRDFIEAYGNYSRAGVCGGQIETTGKLKQISDKIYQEVPVCI